MDYDRSVYFCALSKVFAYKCAAGKHLIETLGSPEAIFRARRDDLFAVLHNAEPFIDKLLDPGLLDSQLPLPLLLPLLAPFTAPRFSRPRAYLRKVIRSSWASNISASTSVRSINI